MKLTCIVGVYNEEKRIGNFLSHATKWADEVIVFDKSSTDHTRDIAQAFGARVETIPFSRQGHEDTRDWVKLARNDWIFFMTCGEVPTPELIEKLNATLDSCGDSVDIVEIPKKLYSFGIHDTRSPWSISYQPFCVHRGRAEISNTIHRQYSLKPGRCAARVEYSESCHVLHPTHATVESFVKSHCDYILAEAEAVQDNPQAAFQNAIRMISAFDFGKAMELTRQALAWRFYWSGVALAAYDKLTTMDVPRFYGKMTDDALRQWSFDKASSV